MVWTNIIKLDCGGRFYIFDSRSDANVSFQPREVGIYVITCPVVGISVLTWFIRYIYGLNLQFSNNVIY